MRVQEAILILNRLKSSKLNIIPIEATSAYPHPPEKVRLDENGRPLFKFVKRVEYMHWLKTQYNLIDKRGDLRNALRRNT